MSRVPLALVLTLTGLVSLGAAQQAAPTPAQLTGLSARQALARANEWRGAGGVQSYVTSEAVMFKFPGGQQRAVALPAGQMVVAIAPYVNHTHPCKTHYMSGCQGEMMNAPVAVTVKNQAGKTVLNRTMNTMANGFLELWLDRDQTYQVTLKASGKKTTGTLSTKAGSDTCVTTLKLQ